jgi:hypothetical protein
MSAFLHRWYRVCVVAGLLFLGACSSTSFVYNRLDFLLPWYVDDYAELNQEQEIYLDELLAPFLAWHRSKELPDYVKILEGIQDSLNQPLTPVAVAAIFNEFEAAWSRLEGESLEWLLELGARLSDEQIAGFLQVLWLQQDEYEEEYLQRSDAEFYQDSYENLRDSAGDYLGTLSDEQRELLRVSSRELLRSDRPWLQERAQWLTELGVLLERKPGWQQRVKDAVLARRKNLTPEYQRIYEQNMGVIYDVLAKLLNGRSAQQNTHLRDKLSGLRDDLEALISESKEAPASASG